MSYKSDLDDPMLEDVCQVLHLGDYLVTFQKEELTFRDLLLLSEKDLASLGLPMGPRKRLLTYLRDLEIRRAKLKQVCCSDYNCNGRVFVSCSYISACYICTFLGRGLESFVFLQGGEDIPAHDSTVSYTIGLAGTGQPSISYPLLEFHPAAFYALGSPTGTRELNFASI